MANHLVGSFRLMKSLNRTLILNVIRTDGPISRAAIAKKTNLTPPTVTNIVGELIESGIVVETDLGESKGGRKPILLNINTSAFQVIGVDVGIKRIKIVATDLNARVIERLEKGIPSQLTEEIFVALLIDGIREIMDKPKLNVGTLMGIGIGMHGLVNPDRGISIFAPNFQLRNIPLRKELEAAFNLPVEVDNDVRAMALGESWFGNGQGFDNFICLNVGNGVGSGIILDGKLYRGTSFTAGEVGHTTVDAEGPQCSCGNYGCLQALVSGPAIAARAEKQIQTGRDTVLSGHDISGEAVYEAALTGDELASEILRETGRYLGIGISNVINTLNPARVIIGGGVAKAEQFIMRPLRETVNARALDTPAGETSIVTAKLGEEATAIGAVTLVLHKLFVPEYN